MLGAPDIVLQLIFSASLFRNHWKVIALAKTCPLVETQVPVTFLIHCLFLTPGAGNPWPMGRMLCPRGCFMRPFDVASNHLLTFSCHILSESQHGSCLPIMVFLLKMNMIFKCSNTNQWRFAKYLHFLCKCPAPHFFVLPPAVQASCNLPLHLKRWLTPATYHRLIFLGS